MDDEKTPNYGPPPNRAQVIEREQIAWQMRCRGWTLQRIADRLGVSREGARKIVARVEERESRRLAQNVHRVKARQNGQIEHIIELGFDAYYKTLEPRTRVVEKVGEGGETVKSTEVVEQMGDPRHLHLVLQAQSAQRDLNGLNVEAAENTGFTLTELTAKWAQEEAAEQEDLRRRFTLEERLAQLEVEKRAEFEAEKRKLDESYGRGGGPPCDGRPGASLGG